MLSPTDISTFFKEIKDALVSGSKDYKLDLKWLMDVGILFQTLGTLKKNGEYSLIGYGLLTLHDTLKHLPTDFSAFTDNKDKINDLINSIATSLENFGKTFAEKNSEDRYKLLEEVVQKTTEVQYWADKFSAALPPMPME